MSLANDSVTVTPGTGATMATHTPTGSTKEHQVVIVADESGHLSQTLPTYTWWIPGQAAAVNKIFGDIFNAVGSGKIVEIRGIWAIPKSDVAVAPVIAVGIGLYRTSTVGSGGTAHTYNGGASAATHVITPWDTNNPTPPAGITARQNPSAGATVSATYWENYIFTEETNAATYISAYTNMLPVGTMNQRITLNEGQGLCLKENATATPIGTIAFLTLFTIVP